MNGTDEAKPVARSGSSLRTALAALFLVVLVGGLVGVLLGRLGDPPDELGSEARAPAPPADTRPDGTRRGPLAYDLTRRPRDEIVGAWREDRSSETPPHARQQRSKAIVEQGASPIIDRTDLAIYPPIEDRRYADTPPEGLALETSSVERLEMPTSEGARTKRHRIDPTGEHRQAVAKASEEMPAEARHNSPAPASPATTVASEDDGETVRPTSERITILRHPPRVVEPAPRLPETLPRSKPSDGPGEAKERSTARPAPSALPQPPLPPSDSWPSTIPLPERNPRADKQGLETPLAAQRAIRRAKLIRMSKARRRPMPVDPLAEYIRDAVEYGVVFTRTGRTSP